MKKILAVSIIFLSLSSCAFYKEEIIHLNLDTANQISNAGNSNRVEVVVFDNRSSKELLGNKRIGKDLVAIKTNQNLADLIKAKMTQGLERKGFVIGEGKIFEIHILSLDYNANRDFFTGHSKASILFKVIIKDRIDVNKKYQRNYGLTIDKDHFIVPLFTTDEGNVNYVLQETIDDIFKDIDLLEILRG